jgi:hypothetical protein
MSDVRDPLDILLRLQRWRTRLERNGADDREARARRETVVRAIDEIERLRGKVARLQHERQTLEQIVTGRPRGLTAMSGARAEQIWQPVLRDPVDAVQQATGRSS